MKMSKVAMAGALAMTLATFGAQAANQGQGVVNFKGAVIDAPCGIAPESADQTVNFGQISKAHLAASGISVKQNLNIKLVGCELAAGAAAKNAVKVTFTGATVSGQPTELGTTGNTGTAILISGQDGKLVTFGTAGTPQKFAGGDNTLHYSTWVKKSSAAGAVLAEGDFAAVANFNLTYE